MKRIDYSSSIYWLFMILSLTIIIVQGLEKLKLENRVRQIIVDLKEQQLVQCKHLRICNSVSATNNQSMDICEGINLNSSIKKLDVSYKEERKKLDSLSLLAYSVYTHNSLILDREFLVRDIVSKEIFLGYVEPISYFDKPCVRWEIFINGEKRDIERNSFYSIDLSDDRTEFKFISYEYRLDKGAVDTTYIRRTIEW